MGPNINWSVGRAFKKIRIGLLGNTAYFVNLVIGPKNMHSY